MKVSKADRALMRVAEQAANAVCRSHGFCGSVEVVEGAESPEVTVTGCDSCRVSVQAVGQSAMLAVSLLAFSADGDRYDA